MATATIERDGTSVTIPLLSDSSGTPLCVKSIGKPNLEVQETGSILPRHIDQWSGLAQYTLTGRFHNNAYSKAITLTDLLKSNSNGDKTLLNIDMPEYDSDIQVAPAAGQDAALTTVYNPGWRDWVEVDLSLTRVSQTQDGGEQPASTPTASGSGPIQLSYQNTTVDLVGDIEVSRSVGRPKSVVRRTPNSKYPLHIDKYKTASDVFELSFEFTQNTVSNVNDIVTMFNQQLGRNSLTLDFNGLYGMGAFNVIPDGSEAVRANRRAGYKEDGLIPTVNLRRVI